jgi:hypothetical protein
MAKIQENINWGHWNFSAKMHQAIQDIPDLGINPIQYIFDTLKLRHDTGELWLEFGVFSGSTIKYISKFTNKTVYGFDSFEGLPEDWREHFPKGSFGTNGEFPIVSNNVELIKGWIEDTLPSFIAQIEKPKVSFIHIDVDLYSATKCILDNLKDYIIPGCIILFDELVNFPEFDKDKSELRAWTEFISENSVDYEWVGMNGSLGMYGYDSRDMNHENVALRILSINN